MYFSRRWGCLTNVGTIVAMRFARIRFIVCLLWMCAPAFAEAPATQPTRGAFLRLIDRPRVELSPREQSAPEDGLLRISFSYASDSANRVPGILLKSAGDDRRPVVIVAHGTGGKKESDLAFMKQLVGKG